MSRTITIAVELSVADDAVDLEVADALLDYLCADEINGLPESIESIDYTEPVSQR
jgi:hypothetical protein